MLSFHRYSAIFVLLFLSEISAFSGIGQTTTTKQTTLPPLSSTNNNDSLMQTITNESIMTDKTSRRDVIKAALSSAIVATLPPEASIAAQEQRCDAVDPRCGADGVLRENVGKPIPRVTNRITHVVQLVINLGERREEVGFLRFGLYGDDCPKTVRTMLEFLTPIGITGVSKEEDLENSIGMQTATVTLLEGGIVPEICPGKAIEFGVPSQKKAFAKVRGLREAGNNFVPQNRPESVGLEAEPSARKHDVAGLISIPEKGIGYATNSVDVDGAYANAFLITADGNPDFDAKLKRRVIGQVIDDESMEFLARISSLPIQKKGPGGKGPPLIKVTVLDIGVQKVGANNSNNQSKKKKK